MVPYVLGATALVILFAPPGLHPLSHVVMGANFGAWAWLLVRLVRR